MDTNSQTPQPTTATTNGSLKRHQSNAVSPPSQPPSTMVVSYKECLKNHAASIGGHALDGCGEYTPTSSSNPTEPRSLTCAACGCHRNFHRRDTHDYHHSNNPKPNFINFYHSPPPPPPHPGLSPSPSPSPSPMSSPSPPPISHHFPPFSHSFQGLGLGNENHHAGFNFNSSKKRHRTKFSQEQKEKMQRFSEKLGWRMQKGDDGMVQEFCDEIGVTRGVFKVWMHNNKNNFSRKRSLEHVELKINGTASDSTSNNPYNTISTNTHSS